MRKIKLNTNSDRPWDVNVTIDSQGFIEIFEQHYGEDDYSNRIVIPPEIRIELIATLIEFNKESDA